MARRKMALYGNRYISWDFFTALRIRNLRWNDEKLPKYDSKFPIRQYPPRLPSVFELGNSTRSDSNGACGLLHLLNAPRHCSTTDPRDKVFALLPIMQSLLTNDPGLPLSNHFKSVVQVYTETAEYLLGENGLKVLSCVQGPALVPGLPSWVPDWSVIERETSSEYHLLLALGVQGRPSAIKEKRELKNLLHSQ
jgi:hypothetical protein